MFISTAFILGCIKTKNGNYYHFLQIMATLLFAKYNSNNFHFHRINNIQFVMSLSLSFG